MGLQMEWLTAGECQAGMHEVVVTDRTTEAIKLASEQNCSLWRVSSTVSVYCFDTYTSTLLCRPSLNFYFFFPFVT